MVQGLQPDPSSCLASPSSAPRFCNPPEPVVLNLASARPYQDPGNTNAPGDPLYTSLSPTFQPSRHGVKQPHKRRLCRISGQSSQIFDEQTYNVGTVRTAQGCAVSGKGVWLQDGQNHKARTATVPLGILCVSRHCNPRTCNVSDVRGLAF